MTCEMCGWALPDDYQWRATCAGCLAFHDVCVDCGCRFGRRLGLGAGGVWAALDGCPDEARAMAAVMGGELGEGAEEAAWRVMREFTWEPNDARTAQKVLELARATGLPASQVIADVSRAGAIGLCLADGREVWSQ